MKHIKYFLTGAVFAGVITAVFIWAITFLSSIHVSAIVMNILFSIFFLALVISLLIGLYSLGKDFYETE